MFNPNAAILQPLAEPGLMYAMRCGQDPDTALDNPLVPSPFMPLRQDTHMGAFSVFLREDMPRGDQELTVTALRALLTRLEQPLQEQLLESVKIADQRFKPPLSMVARLGEQALTRAA